MAFADSNRGTVRFCREASWGVAPAGPAMTTLRLTSESLRHVKESAVSAELRADRQRAALLEVARRAEGEIAFELTFGDFEPLLEGALRAAIASTRIEGESLAFAASTVTAGAALWEDLRIGQNVRIHGATAGIDGIYAVEAIAGGVLTLTGSTVAAEATTIADAVVEGRMIRNGTAAFSHLIETAFEDIGAHAGFSGMEVAQLTLAVASQAIVTGSFAFLGKEGFAAASSLASAVVPATDNAPMTATANVADLSEGGSALAAKVQSLRLALDNNLRARAAVAHRSPVGIGAGGIDVGGTLQAYFEDTALFQKFLDHTATSLALRLVDGAGNAMVVTLPRLHYTTGTPDLTGQDADVFLPLEFTAVRDPATGCTVQLDLLPAEA